jgi:hypothetical protein
MKTKINRRIYDTEVAQPLAIYINSQPEGSIFHFSEILYIKSDGEYFLHGSGGSMTPYAKKYQSRSNASGEAIVPLSMDQAKVWVKRWCTSGLYREIFGEELE